MNWNDLNIQDMFERISPITIEGSSDSIKLGISRKFMLFEFLNEVKELVEDDPYLNFISVLKYYKVLGRFIYGSIHELHRDREKPYFRDFFIDRELHRMIVKDLEWAYSYNKDLKLTITKHGLLTYDNFQKNKFNLLLMTIHSGHWLPESLKKNQLVSDTERIKEEDIASDRIYGRLVLEKSGIWIDNKLSRFACDFNRSPGKAIYRDYSEEWLQVLWKKKISESDSHRLLNMYNEFYFTLSKLIETYKFNIIFDAHSMRHGKGRPDISFGCRFIPRFYMPVVAAMEKKLSATYTVFQNAPFSGGYILEFLSKRFPDVFVFSMEVNKRLYMNNNRSKVKQKRLSVLSKDLLEIFNL